MSELVEAEPCEHCEVCDRDVDKVEYSEMTKADACSSCIAATYSCDCGFSWHNIDGAKYCPECSRTTGPVIQDAENGYLTLLNTLEGVWKRERDAYGHCPGWFVCSDPAEVERCDDCDRFPSDADAMSHAIARLTDEAGFARGDYVGPQWVNCEVDAAVPEQPELTCSQCGYEAGSVAAYAMHACAK